MTEQAEINWKKKYKELKRKTKGLIIELACHEHDIRVKEAKISALSRDNSLLLERLLEHEPAALGDNLYDFEMTDSSDNDNDPTAAPPAKKRNVQSSTSKTAAAVGRSRSDDDVLSRARSNQQKQKQLGLEIKKEGSVVGRATLSLATATSLKEIYPAIKKELSHH